MKKTILLTALLAASSSAFADIDSLRMPELQVPQFMINPFVRSDVHALAADPANEQAALSVQERVVESPESARTAFRVWSEDEKQGQYASWPEVGMNMLRWLEPARGFDWKHGTRAPGASEVIYQQDSLVDLERAMAVNVTSPISVDEGYGYQVYDPLKGKARIPGISRSLLAQGYAPIGPDNIPVQVCRIGMGSQAPFVELSQTQRLRFQVATGLKFTVCLNGGQAQTYWKSRYADFMDSYHDITDRHQPAGSY